MRLTHTACSFLAATSISLLSHTAIAAPADWSKSYQLETAQKYSEAITALDSIAANSPEAELKSLRRGWLYYLLGSYNESIREYRNAIERGDSVDARLGITLPLLAQQRWREAELHAADALKLSSNNYTALLRLAIAQEGQKNWSGMLQTTQKLSDLYPTDASAFVYLARAYAWLGKTAEAKAAYTAVLSRYPGHLEASKYLEKNR